MSALRVEPNLCHFRKRKLVSSQNGEAGGRDTFRRRWWPRPKRAVAVGLESRRQIQEGLGENQGTVVAVWMWEMRIETVVPGDSKIYDWVAGQIGGSFIELENGKGESVRGKELSSV